MSKWPELFDREWPTDIPFDYYFPEDRAPGTNVMSWRGFGSIVLGLCRRVDELERRMAILVPDKSDDI